MSIKENKIKLPRWQRLTLHDLTCLSWWVVLYIIFSVWFETFPALHLKLNLTTSIRKLTFSLVTLIGNLVFFQTVLGTGGLLKATWRWLITPFTILRLSWGFLRDSRQTFRKIKKNFPVKTTYFLSLPTTILLGFYESNHFILKSLIPILFFQIAYTLYKSLRWSINPLALFHGIKILSTEKVKSKIIDTLVSFDKKLSIVPLGKLIEKIHQWKSVATLISMISSALNKPTFLFSCFMFVWSFSMIFVITASASLIRIYHFLSSVPVFGGSFFTGKISDFLYITAYQFVGSDLHGYKIISPVVQHVFVFLPYASMFLMVVVILAFSTVAQSRMEKGIKSIDKFSEEILTTALAQLSSLDMKVEDKMGNTIENQKIQQVLSQKGSNEDFPLSNVN